MEAKMGRFFESVGNFFTDGDNIPWCDRDLIAVRTPEIPFLAASI
jgi:fission 1 protein